MATFASGLANQWLKLPRSHQPANYLHRLVFSGRDANALDVYHNVAHLLVGLHIAMCLLNFIKRKGFIDYRDQIAAFELFPAKGNRRL